MAANPEFPDMDTARDRLGSLLKNIRHKSNFPAAVASNGKRSSSARDDDDDDSEFSDMEESVASPVRHQPRSSATALPSKMERLSPTKGDGSSKKMRPSQKKIIFELRQKAFEIQNPNVEHGLYALCRIWMRGKCTKGGEVTGEPIDRSTVDFDHESLLAARSLSRKSTVRPETDRPDSTTVTGEETAASEILDQYLPRWRQAKKDWCQQRNKDDVEKYGDSLRVLREMYDSAQNHLINM